MTIKQILDEVYPFTFKEKKCAQDRSKWEYNRLRLQKMIEDYGKGEVVNFEPLKVSVDLESILSKLSN